MKVYCEKCHENISNDVDLGMERFEVGSIKCVKCNHLQNRYITETDLQLYAGLSELTYLILTTLGLHIIDQLHKSLWYGLIFIPFVIGAFFAIKTFSRWIYLKAPGKTKTANRKIKENPEKISKTMKSQNTIFFLLAFASILIDKYRWEMLGGMLIITIASFAKYYVCISNEKKLDVNDYETKKVR